MPPKSTYISNLTLLALAVAVFFAARAMGANQPQSRLVLKPQRSLWSVSYWGDFSGPTVGHFSPYKSSTEGEILLNNPIELYSELALGYRVNPRWKLYTKAIWLTQPNTINTEQMLTALDPKVGASNSRLVKTDRFSMYASFSAPVPVSESSQDSGLVLAPGTFQIMEYKLGNSPWSLRNMLSARFYFYKTNGDRRNFKFEVWPGVRYRHNSSLKSEAFFDYATTHNWNQNLQQWNWRHSAFNLSLVWQASKNWEINPQLRYYNMNRVSWATTQVGAYLSGRLL